MHMSVPLSAPSLCRLCSAEPTLGSLATLLLAASVCAAAFASSALGSGAVGPATVRPGFRSGPGRNNRLQGGGK